jgi:cysteine synthase B
MGAGRRLREHNPDVQIIAAEPELGELVYGLRSLEEGFIPPVFDPAFVDGKFLVGSKHALRSLRELTEKEGIFAGISSGAVIHVAVRIAERIDEGDIVCLLADGGWKYLSSDAWSADLETAEKQVETTLWW